MSFIYRDRKEIYCLCRCPCCGASWREWVNMRFDCVDYALCACDRCKMVVNALCIPLDLHYAW